MENFWSIFGTNGLGVYTSQEKARKGAEMLMSSSYEIVTDQMVAEQMALAGFKVLNGRIWLDSCFFQKNKILLDQTVLFWLNHSDDPGSKSFGLLDDRLPAVLSDPSVVVIHRSFDSLSDDLIYYALASENICGIVCTEWEKEQAQNMPQIQIQSFRERAKAEEWCVKTFNQLNNREVISLEFFRETIPIGKLFYRVDEEEYQQWKEYPDNEPDGRMVQGKIEY